MLRVHCVVRNLNVLLANFPQIILILERNMYVQQKTNVTLLELAILFIRMRDVGVKVMEIIVVIVHILEPLEQEMGQNLL